MTDIVITPATIEPLTVAQAKAHLRSTTSAEDALVGSIVSAARSYAETFLTQALVLTGRRLTLDGFPTCIEGAWGPLRAVQSVQYMDLDGQWQTVEDSTYRVLRQGAAWKIELADGEIWPTVYRGSDVVRVEYTAGYLIPFTVDADTDTLAAAGHGYADGEVTRIQTIGGTLPTFAGLATGVNAYVRDATDDTLKLALTSGGSAIDCSEAGTAPNVLGILPKEIEQALQLLIQYFEQRDATTAYKAAAEAMLWPLRYVRF